MLHINFGGRGHKGVAHWSIRFEIICVVVVTKLSFIIVDHFFMVLLEVN